MGLHVRVGGHRATPTAGSHLGKSGRCAPAGFSRPDDSRTGRAERGGGVRVTEVVGASDPPLDAPGAAGRGVPTPDHGAHLGRAGGPISATGGAAAASFPEVAQHDGEGSRPVSARGRDGLPDVPGCSAQVRGRGDSHGEQGGGHRPARLQRQDSAAASGERCPGRSREVRAATAIYWSSVHTASSTKIKQRVAAKTGRPRRTRCFAADCCSPDATRANWPPFRTPMTES